MSDATINLDALDNPAEKPNRKVELFHDERWVEIPFEKLSVGDVFRLWDLVVDQDNQLGQVTAWRCKSPPEEIDGVLGCRCEPVVAIRLPEAEPTAEQTDD